MKRLVLAVLALAVLSVAAFAQVQIEDRGVSPTATPSIYWPINQTGGSELWSLDSAATDTSAYYKIVPGLYYTLTLKTSGVAGDSLRSVRIFRNTIPSTVGAEKIDSIITIAGATQSTKDILGGAAGLKYPVMARYLYVVVVGATTGAAGATTIDAKMWSSVLP